MFVCCAGDQVMCVLCRRPCHVCVVQETTSCVCGAADQVYVSCSRSCHVCCADLVMMFVCYAGDCHDVCMFAVDHFMVFVLCMRLSGCAHVVQVTTS